jgi:hypothetical protein
LAAKTPLFLPPRRHPDVFAAKTPRRQEETFFGPVSIDPSIASRATFILVDNFSDFASAVIEAMTASLRSVPLVQARVIQGFVCSAAHVDGVTLS